MFFNKNLEEIVFNKHKENGANKLLVISGYIGPSPIDKISQLDLKTEVVYGCYAERGIQKEFHEKNIYISKNTNTKILYASRYNHSKIYCWLKNDLPVDILTGSANFSTKGLNNDNEEILVSVNKKDFSEIYNFVLETIDNSNCCKDVNISNKIKVKKQYSQRDFLDEIVSKDPPRVNLYIGASGRKIPSKSGINWGHGEGNNAKDVAELRIRVDLIKRIPEFFPNNGININHGKGQAYRNSKPNAEILFDDGVTMDLRFEQKAESNDQVYYKALCSYPKKNTLGKYIRERMGLKFDQKITEKHVHDYGRDTIDITLLEKGIYYGDFSVK